MENNIYRKALEIVRNAARKTNCRKFVFNDSEVAQFIMDKFYPENILDIHQRLENGEFILIKEICDEYLTLNTRCNCFELYITIGEDTYLLYSQYNQDIL